MGELVYFCAGADKRKPPSSRVKALLLNVPRNGHSQGAIKRSRRLIKKCGAKFVILDSGGYQLLKSSQNGTEIIYDENGPIWSKNKINLTPTHVIEAAVRIKPDILMALDFPIDKVREKEKQEVEFRRKLGFNIDWAIRTADLRKKYCPEIRLFIPVQCYTIEHLNIFLRAIEGIKYDGLSMPVRNMSLADIASFLLAFYRKGIRQVHLFGTLTMRTLAICAFMARNFFDWVSLDSTNWQVSAKHNKYMTNSLRLISVKDEKGMVMKCFCPHCQGKSLSYIKRLSYRKRSALLRKHNLWMTEKVVRDIFRASKDLETMQRFLERRKVKPRITQQILESLKMVSSKGINR